MNSLKQQTKKTRSHWFFALGISLMGGTNVSLAQSSDLIAFGKACLAEEQGLNEEKSQLDALSLKAKQAQTMLQQPMHEVNHYYAEKKTLEEQIKHCAETTPNSAYCHKIRYRYHAVNQLIEEYKGDSITNSWEWHDLVAQYKVTKSRFDQKHRLFIDLCRDSDTHYALIKDPTAYTEVCFTSAAKASLTCSFF